MLAGRQGEKTSEKGRLVQDNSARPRPLVCIVDPVAGDRDARRRVTPFVLYSRSRG